MKKQKINGATIARLRKSLGLNQSQLAEYAGISVQALVAIETGKSQPKEETLNMICQRLNVATEELYIPDQYDIGVELSRMYRSVVTDNVSVLGSSLSVPEKEQIRNAIKLLTVGVFAMYTDKEVLTDEDLFNIARYFK